MAVLLATLLALVSTDRPGNHSGERSKDTGSLQPKLSQISKIKECCGYPLAMKEGFRLSFYWLAYEAEYANEDYDTDIYTKQGYFIGRPMPWLGFPLRRQASTMSGFARTRPVVCGPRMPFPPLKTTTSAPVAVSPFKFRSGGTSAAASTMTGTFLAWAISRTSGRRRGRLKVQRA